VVICSCNDHVRLLSPEPVGRIQHHQFFSGLGADIVMESIALIERSGKYVGRSRGRRVRRGDVS
jgi:hypothetical protein